MRQTAPCRAFLLIALVSIACGLAAHLPGLAVLHIAGGAAALAAVAALAVTAPQRPAARRRNDAPPV